MTIDTITREALIEKLKQYPTLLQQFMVLVDTQGTTLDDIQEILKLAQQASSESSTSLEKVNTLSTKLDNEINRAVVEELTLQASVAKEKADRVSSDNTLQENIDGKQDKLTAGENITIEGNVISSTTDSGTDEKISKLEDKIDNEINRALNEELSLQGNITKEKEDRVSADNTLQENIDAKQDKLTAGDNIKIEGNVISATGGSTPIDYVDLSSEQTISGIKTFTNEVKTNQIANVNDNAMLRYKESENKVVVGGSTIPTTIMGSGDRPTYSKDGSDFNGSPLALLSDVRSGVGGTKLYAHLITGSAHTSYIQELYSTPIKMSLSLKLWVVNTRESAYTSLEEVLTDAKLTNFVRCALYLSGSRYMDACLYKSNNTLYIYGIYSYVDENVTPPTNNIYSLYYIYAQDESWDISDTVTEL